MGDGITQVWSSYFILSKPITESRRADSNRFPAHYELACGYPGAYHHVPVRGLSKPKSSSWRRRPSYCVPIRTDPVAVRSRVSRLLALLRVAACCTVLRSRWYQSGINVTLHPRGSRAPTKARARRTSALRFGQALQRVRIRNINLSVPSLHGTRFPEHPEGPGNRLTVRSLHAR
jgi:hypothetical protein